MRSEGYKCYNTECGCCIGGKRCGEPFDIALGCDSRMVRRKTNADHIRSMTDEELADFLVDLADDGNLLIREWLKQPYKEDA